MKRQHRRAPDSPTVKRRFRLKLAERAERAERRIDRAELQEREAERDER